MPQKDPWIMFCFLIQYEMEWKPIWSESGARSMRPRGKPGLSPNHSAFWGVRGKLNFLTWEHPKNCIYVTWVMKRPNGIREGFYHLRRCLCTEWNSALDIFPWNVYLRARFLSIKPTLIYSGELENEMSQLSAIFSILLHVSSFSQYLTGSEGQIFRPCSSS